VQRSSDATLPDLDRYGDAARLVIFDATPPRDPQARQRHNREEDGELAETRDRPDAGSTRKRSVPGGPPGIGGQEGAQLRATRQSD